MLQVCDTGQGFNIDQMDFRHLLMDRRFGLIGMQERATLIGADLQIESTSGSGTRITLTWHAENHVDDSA
jgi:signal transduction histidine kinase